MRALILIKSSSAALPVACSVNYEMTQKILTYVKSQTNSHMETLNNFTEILTQKAGQILPGILGAIIVLIVGILIASGIKRLVLLLFKRTKLDDQISKKTEGEFELTSSSPN